MITLATDKHRNYITSSWKNTYRKDWAGKTNPMLPMPNQEYHTGQSMVIDKLLRTCPALVWEEDDIIMSWVVAQPKSRVLHYVYTRDLFRNEGIGTKMLNAIELDFTQPYYLTHFRPGMQKCSLLVKGIYNPYLLIEP